MSGLAQRILGRFPAHLEATRPGKLLGAVVEGLATDLQAIQVELGAVRRAHRLGHADQLVDVLGLAGLHGLDRADLALLTLRFAEVRRRVAALRALYDSDGPVDPAARDALAAAVLALWPVDWDALGLPAGSVLPFSTPSDAPPDLDAAALGLAEDAAASVNHAASLAAARQRVAEICRIQAQGNGTVGALLAATANALDLDVVRVVHSQDRFWHAAEVRERIPLTTIRLTPEGPRPVRLPLTTDVIGLEENPPHRAETDRVARYHAEPFEVVRSGFERVPLQVQIHGLGDRTVGPRITQRDEGHGLGYAGPPLADGQALIFAEDGHVRLDGADVTAMAYAWRGACFADACAPHPNDFVFADPDSSRPRAARFAVATPEGALDREFVFPHAGRPLPMPGVAVGTTRLAFFVQLAHASHLGRSAAAASPPGSPPASPPAAGERAVTPRYTLGLFDGSVFADADHPPPRRPCPTVAPAAPADSAEISLSWWEREAYAVRLWLPPRLRALAGEDEDVLGRVVRAAGRVRPAGVDLRAAWISDEWILGESVLVGAEGDDLLLRLLPGTALWPTDDEDRGE